MIMKYKIEKLGNLVELKQGLAINSQSNYLVSEVETSLSLLRIADMPTKRKVIFMSEKTPSRYIANRDDIIYTRTGQVGLVFTGQEGVVHNNCFRVNSLNEKVLLNKYLYWVLKSKYLYTLANTYAAGAAQPDLPHTSFKKIKIPLPDINLQQKIANILSRYDEAIENNNKRIKLLEQMAQNLYKEWFVRFRFPGYENCEFENGIPVGWKYKNLFDVVNVTYGYAFASELFCDDESLNPVVRIRDILDNYTKTFTSEECSDKYIIKENEILIGMDGIFHMCMWNGGKAYQNQRVVKLTAKTEVYSNYFLFLAVQPQIKFWEQTIAGTTVAHLGDKHLKRINVLIPSDDILKQATIKFNLLMKQKNSLFKANKNLVKQRDLLLPRLMSGKLEVN